MLRKKVVLFSIILITTLSIYFLFQYFKSFSITESPKQSEKLSIEFIKVNNQGKKDDRGGNYVIIFDPKSPELDFKVNLGISHNLYTRNGAGKYIKDYIPKSFRELISDKNAELNGQKPFSAINSDYIDTENKPQGLNVSRGIEYAGAFVNKRSSFAISGGSPQQRIATIQVGKREEKILNFNVVGGNGRFYNNGVFKNICQDLGEYACYNETNRSMVAITSKGYVILLVNNSEPNKELYPDNFARVLNGISETYFIGTIQEGMLFDGGLSTALYYNNRIYVENSNPMGSVFLIYKK